MKKIILFLLLSVSIFGKLDFKVIYSDPAETKTKNISNQK